MRAPGSSAPASYHLGTQAARWERPVHGRSRSDRSELDRALDNDFARTGKIAAVIARNAQHLIVADQHVIFVRQVAADQRELPAVVGRTDPQAGVQSPEALLDAGRIADLAGPVAARPDAFAIEP